MESSSQKVTVDLHIVGKVHGSLFFQKGEPIFIKKLREEIIPNYLKQDPNYSYVYEQLKWNTFKIRAYNIKHKEVFPLKTKKKGLPYFEVNDDSIIQYFVAECDLQEIKPNEEEKIENDLPKEKSGKLYYDYFEEFAEMQKKIDKMDKQMQGKLFLFMIKLFNMAESEKERTMSRKKIEESENKIEESEKKIEESEKKIKASEKRIEQLGKL